MKKVQTISWIAALCLVGVGAYAVAQPTAAAGAGKQCDHGCPLHQVAELSDVKVESTKQGAVIQLVAKRPEDVSKVQEQAQQMAAMLKASEDCPMHQGHGGMHQHGHK